jgi:hypothetical protein
MVFRLRISNDQLERLRCRLIAAATIDQLSSIYIHTHKAYSATVSTTASGTEEQQHANTAIHA